MTGFFLWEPTGAQFYVPRSCQWGKQLEAEGWKWTEPRPAEPSKAYGTPPVWFRGWECSYDATAAFWGAEGWRAAKGGWDLDCQQTSGRTWSDLLDEIEAEESD